MLMPTCFATVRLGQKKNATFRPYRDQSVALVRGKLVLLPSLNLLSEVDLEIVISGRHAGLRDAHERIVTQSCDCHRVLPENLYHG